MSNVLGRLFPHLRVACRVETWEKGSPGVRLCLSSEGGVIPELPLDWFSSDHSVMAEEALLVLKTLSSFKSQD